MYHRNAHAQQLMDTVLQARSMFVDVAADTDSVMFTNGDGPTVTIHGVISDAGVDTMRVRPTRRAHTQLAGRAGVPRQFYDRLAADHQELWEHTMNELYPQGKSLFRIRRDGDGLPVMRAALSDRYQVIDNVDVLTHMLKAFADAGLAASHVAIDGDLDVDDGLLRIRCTVPSIGIAARELVSRYRSPFDGRTGQELPMIFAGLEISNSETGGGAFTIRPRAVLQVCSNGMTRDAATEQFRRVHLGARLDQSGVVQWSDETRTKQLELIGSAAGDAIRTFISPQYLRGIVDAASKAAGLAVTDVTESHAAVVKLVGLSDDEARAALNLFTTSADLSQLGWAHAVTALAQKVESSDRQAELELAFWQIVDAERMAGIG